MIKLPCHPVKAKTGLYVNKCGKQANTHSSFQSIQQTLTLDVEWNMLASHQGTNVNFTVTHLKFDEVYPASFYTEDIAFSDSCFGNV